MYEWELTSTLSSRLKELPKKPADAARTWNSEIANCRASETVNDKTVSEAEGILEVEDEAVATLIADEADLVLGADHDHRHQRGIATMVMLEARSAVATGTFRKVVEAAPVTTDTGALGAARVLPPILHGLTRGVQVRSGLAAPLIIRPALVIAMLHEAEREVRQENAPERGLALRTGTLPPAGETRTGGGGARGLGPSRGHPLGPDPGLDPPTAVPRPRKDAVIHPLLQFRREMSHGVVDEGVLQALPHQDVTVLGRPHTPLTTVAGVAA